MNVFRLTLIVLVACIASAGMGQTSYPVLNLQDRPSTATAPVARAGHEVLYVQDGEWRLGTLVAADAVRAAGGGFGEPGQIIAGNPGPGEIHLYDLGEVGFGIIRLENNAYILTDSYGNPAPINAGGLTLPGGTVDSMAFEDAADYTPTTGLGDLALMDDITLSLVTDSGTLAAEDAASIGVNLVPSGTRSLGLAPGGYWHTAYLNDVFFGNGNRSIIPSGNSDVTFSAPVGALTLSAENLNAQSDSVTVTTDNPVAIKNIIAPGGPAAIEVGDDTGDKITIANSSSGGTVTSTFDLGIESVGATSITATDLTVNAPLLVDDDAEVTGDFLLVGVLGGDYRRSLVTTNQSINTTGEYLESGLTYVQTSTTNPRTITLPTGPSWTSVSNGHFVDIVNVGTRDFIIYPDWVGNPLQYDGDAGMDMFGSSFTLKPGSSCRALMTASGWILTNVSGTIEFDPGM